MGAGAERSCLVPGTGTALATCYQAPHPARGTRLSLATTLSPEIRVQKARPSLEGPLSTMPSSSSMGLTREVSAEALRQLRTHFGHREYRDGQEQIVEAVLGGHYVLAVMPT